MIYIMIAMISINYRYFFALVLFFLTSYKKFLVWPTLRPRCLGALRVKKESRPSPKGG